MIMATIIKSTDSLTEPPLTTASRRSLPPRGSREAADNFCFIVRKHDEARGSLWNRLTIFARKNEVR